MVAERLWAADGVGIEGEIIGTPQGLGDQDVPFPWAKAPRKRSATELKELANDVR